MQDIMDISSLEISVLYRPMCVEGILISILNEYFLHLVAGLGWIISFGFFAVAPLGASY